MYSITPSKNDDDPIKEKFFKACEEGDIPEIKKWRGKVFYNENIPLALQAAARGGDRNTVKYLIKMAGNITRQKRSLLDAAVIGGSIDVVMYLCDIKRNPYTHNDYDDVIDLAAHNRDLNMIKLLIKIYEKKLNVAYSVPRDGWSMGQTGPLATAIDNEDLLIVEYLTEKGITNVSNRGELSPIELAVTLSKIEVTKYFLKADDVDQTKLDSLLVSASYDKPYMKEQLEILKLLIDSGANIHANNDSAFNMAAKDGVTQTTEYLFEQNPQYFSNFIQEKESLANNPAFMALINRHDLLDKDEHPVKRRMIKV